jgi:hypothetical protein
LGKKENLSKILGKFYTERRPGIREIEVLCTELYTGCRAGVGGWGARGIIRRIKRAQNKKDEVKKGMKIKFEDVGVVRKGAKGERNGRGRKIRGTRRIRKKYSGKSL